MVGPILMIHSADAHENCALQSAFNDKTGEPLKDTKWADLRFVKKITRQRKCIDLVVFF